MATYEWTYEELGSATAQRPAMEFKCEVEADVKRHFPLGPDHLGRRGGYTVPRSEGEVQIKSLRLIETTAYCPPSYQHGVEVEWPAERIEHLEAWLLRQAQADEDLIAEVRREPELSCY